MAGVQSIERAFAVLRDLALGPPGSPTSPSGRRSSQVDRVPLLSALEAEGAVAQRQPAASTSSGRARRAGRRGEHRGNMAAVVRPFLIELTKTIGESVGLRRASGANVYWVDNIEQVAPVQVQDQTGHYARMHTVPSGLTLLAMLDDDALDRYLAEPLESVTVRTPTDPIALRKKLGAIRTAGLYWSFEELELGINAIAVPFVGPSGEHDGAIYVNGPSYRFPHDGDKTRVEKLVTEAARRLTERFTLH